MVLLAQVLTPRAEAAVGATTAAVPASEAAQARIAAPRPRWSLVFMYFLSRRAPGVPRSLIDPDRGIISVRGARAIGRERTMCTTEYAVSAYAHRGTRAKCGRGSRLFI